MRIKCPACGSTAQPELVYLDHRSNCTRKKDVYECGCGCRFYRKAFSDKLTKIFVENQKKS